MLTFPPGKNLSPAENAVFITYLDDENLREFIPFAAEKKWASGVLPHPGNKYTSKGLGISEKTEEAVAEILKNEETHNLDILFCNGLPVFQSVNIGDVFALTESGKNTFTAEVFRFLRNIRKLPSLTTSLLHYKL